MYLPKYAYLLKYFCKPLLIASLLVITGSATANSTDRHATDGQITDHEINLSYESAFANYRYFADQSLQDWYQLNQTVDEIGGWRYYIQEPFKQPLSGQQSPSQKSPADKNQNMHHHHHNHGGAK